MTSPQANRLVLSMGSLRFGMHLKIKKNLKGQDQKCIINLWFTLEGSREKMEGTVEGEDESHQKQTQNVKGKEIFMIGKFG